MKEAASLVDGLEIDAGEAPGQCEDCIIGNMKRRPYDDEIQAETIVLRRTNIDIWGPARVVSVGGSVYAMKFHDNGSSHRKTFFLTNRLAETTLHALETYKLESKKITGKKMVFIRTDNAPEFKSKLWADYLKKNGLIFTPTAPYSSPTNGTAEQSIGITTGAVRVMMLDAQLSTKWWAEAWAFAEYVENRLPSARHPGMIPEEVWTNQKQDVGHIRVWGCIAYVHIPREKNGGKLGNRGIKGRLIGIEGRGLYRVLIPETGEIIRSRNVKFEEGSGHRTLTTEGEYFHNDDGDHDYSFLQDENPSVSIIQIPVVDPKPDAQDNQPGTNPIPQVSRPRIVYPPASRRSSRLAAKTLDTNNAVENEESVTDSLDDATIPILEDNDEDDSPMALNAGFPPEPLNHFVPETFAEAFDITRRHLWFPAMEKEIERWDERGVVTPVARPKGVKTIKGKWVYDLKIDGMGALMRRRARGVVKGFTQ